MCLIEDVIKWNETFIECSTSTHRNPANPLRTAGRLSAISAIEYAAQAMAIHGALVAKNHAKPAFGFLASLRNVQFEIDFLDHIEAPLAMRCHRLMGDEHSCMYDFSVMANDVVLVAGRASVFQAFGAGAP